MTSDVLTLGETMVMLTPTAAEPLETTARLDVHAGGAESNVAAWLVSEGVPTCWVSRVGDDPLGRRLVAEVRARGVDVSRVQVDPDAPTGLYLKDPTPEGTRVHYYRRGSAASRMDVALLDGLPLDTVRLVHLTGITPGLSPSCAELVDGLLDRARAAGVPVSFDVNFRPGVWPVPVAAPRLHALADRADVVLVGLDEARTVWGATTPEEVRALLPGPGRVVVKDAAAGATELTAAGAVHVPAHRVRVVEPVGAGDAFAGGYLAALLHGADPEAALRRGHDLAARALTATSDVPLDPVPPDPDPLDPKPQREDRS